MASSSSRSNPQSQPSCPSVDNDSSSIPSDTEEEALERAALNASIRRNRRAARRENRRFARLLARCTPAIVGAELAAEIYAEFGSPEEEHLVSSDGADASSSAEDETPVDSPKCVSDKPAKGPDGSDAQPPPAGSAVISTVSLH